MADINPYREYLVLGIHILQIPSFLLYLVFLFILIRYRKSLEMSLSFLTICISVGVADVLYVVISTTHRFIEARATFQQWDVFLQKLYALALFSGWNGSYFSQLTGVLLLSVNRFSAIMRPLQYQQIWEQPYVLPLAIVAQWTPTAGYLAMMVAHPMMSLELHNRTRLGVSIQPDGRAAIYGSLVGYLYLLAVLIIVMYSLMFLKLMAHRKRLVAPAADGGGGGGQQKSSERKFAAVGAVLGLCVVYFAFSNTVGFLEEYSGTPAWLKRAITEQGGRDLLRDYVSTVVDFIFTFSNPYLLLATSSQCRRTCWSLLPVLKGPTTGTSSVRTVSHKAQP